MRLTAFALVAMAWAVGATAQSLDPASIYVLEASAGAETSDDLGAILVDAPTPLSDMAFWTDAVSIGATSLAEEPIGRASIARLMEAALIRAGAEPDTTPLDRLSPGDIRAMQDAVGFPDSGDLLIYLLNRGPSIFDSFEFESYTVVRLSPEGEPFRIVQERADRPYLGIQTTFGINFVDARDDPVSLADSEHAKTRRLNLAALPDIVLAAKAFRAARRAPQDQSVYPLLIAVSAVNRALLDDPRHFRPVVYFAELLAQQELDVYAGNDATVLRAAQEFEYRLPRTAFFARLFEDAAAAYATAPVTPDDLHGQVWASWGEAISRFAYEGDPGPAFSRVASLIGPETPEHAALLGLLLDYTPTNEAMQFGDVDGWRERVSQVIGTNSTDEDEPPDRAVERDFALQLATIGRPDIASRFLMDRIRSASGPGEETQYLLWIAPFIREYCYLISFRISASSDWVHRETQGYDAHLDFLDNFNSDGQLVGAGEVVLSDGSYVPYPMLSPEEDCAAAFAVYGVVDNVLSAGLLGQTPKEERSETVAGFEAWVQDAMTRTEAAPSLVPYLKLIWIDWFAQAFEALKNPAFTATTFRYDAVDASALTSVDRVRELLEHPAATPHQQHLIELFIETREFFEDGYP